MIIYAQQQTEIHEQELREAKELNEKLFPKPEVATISELLRLVNIERKKIGVAPLKLDNRLNKSAQKKANIIVDTNYFQHKGKDGKQGYMFAIEYAPDICQIASENLSELELGNVITAEDAVDGWISSPSHYSAMVNANYTYTGFGISGEKVVVEHFC